MTRFILTILFFLSSIIILTAQTSVVDVKINLKNGETVEALMRINTNEPWRYQSGLVTFPKELRDAVKIRKKDYKTYKAKEILSCEYNGRYYKSVKVAINAREEYGSQLHMLPGHSLLQRFQEGTISVYLGYPTPKGGLSGDLKAKVYKDHRTNPDFFIEKATMKKIKNMDIVNMEKLIKDCPKVAEKYKNGEYGNYAMEDGKKLKNFMKKVSSMKDYTKKLDMIAEYNTIMASEASK